MTAYHGGKFRLGGQIASAISQIASCIEKRFGVHFTGYCEPFCGMLGVYRHVPQYFEDRKMMYKAGDTNKSLILMWKRAQKGWKPPEKCDPDEYKKLKTARPSALKGFIGFQCSFGGQFFQGYHKHREAPAARASRRVSKIATDLEMVRFSEGSYSQFSKLKNYIIYCDPPYSSSHKYIEGEEEKRVVFDHDAFWDWVRRMSKHNLVLVSEYEGPSDFFAVDISLTTVSYGKVGKARKRIEKLFIYEYSFAS